MSRPRLSADDTSAHPGLIKDTVYTWIAEKGVPVHRLDCLWEFESTRPEGFDESEVRTIGKNAHALKFSHGSDLSTN